MSNREIDRKVAEVVMGWKHSICQEQEKETRIVSKCDSCGSYTTAEEFQDVPEYSTSISDAWAVVERMRKLGWFVMIQHHNGGLSNDFDAEFQIHDRYVRETDASLPTAICLAALACFGGKE